MTARTCRRPFSTALCAVFACSNNAGSGQSFCSSDDTTRDCQITRRTCARMNCIVPHTPCTRRTDVHSTTTVWVGTPPTTWVSETTAGDFQRIRRAVRSPWFSVGTRRPGLLRQNDRWRPVRPGGSCLFYTAKSVSMISPPPPPPLLFFFVKQNHRIIVPTVNRTFSDRVFYNGGGVPRAPKKKKNGTRHRFPMRNGNTRVIHV